MKNKTMLIIAAIIIIVMGGFVFIKGKSGVTADVVSIDRQIQKGQVQRVILSQEGLNYKDTTAQASRPITVSADSSVKGCLRSVVFNINGKKYSKYLRTQEDTIELPALAKGIYSFSCSMGMGYGKLNVK